MKKLKRANVNEERRIDLAMRLLGISGSLRQQSFNSGLLRHCEMLLSKKGVELQVLSSSLIGSLPLFNADTESVHHKAHHVQELLLHLHKADGFIFATCEYNGSISAAMKNTLDWGSRSPHGNCFDSKPAAIIGAGGYAGKLLHFQHPQQQTHKS
jgi:NAD(P)H-dependent FMN reductase